VRRWRPLLARVMRVTETGDGVEIGARFATEQGAPEPGQTKEGADSQADAFRWVEERISR
jgi:hypothetical protein